MKNIISRFKKGVLFGVLVGLCVTLAIVNVRAWLPVNNPVSVVDGDHLTAALWNDHVNKLIELNNRPAFITPVEIISGAPVDVMANFATFNATSAGVPVGARGVILEAKALMSGPNWGSAYSDFLVRKDAGSSSYVLIRGLASGGGDVTAWAEQGFFPITDAGTFQYKVDNVYFENLSVHLIGYF